MSVEQEHHRKTLIFILLYIVIYYTLILFGTGNEPFYIISRNLMSTSAAFIAAIWLIRAFKTTVSIERIVWFWLSLGCWSYFSAELIWMYYESFLRTEVPFPGLSDLFYMLQILFYLVAFSRYQFIVKRFSRILQLIFEIVIVMIVISTFSYYFIIEHQMSNPELTGLFLFISIGYPVGDLALIFAAVTLFCTVKESTVKRKFLVILIAVIIQAVADSSYMYLLLNNNYHTGSLIDPLFSLSLLLIGYSGIHANGIKTNKKIDAFFMKFDILRILLPYVGSLGLVLYIILMDREHQILTIGGFLAIFLIIVKQISVLYNNKQLLRHLNRSNERFQSLFDHHPDAVVSINLKGELTRVNNTAAKMANCSNEDLIGLQFDSFFEGEDMLKVRKHFHLACQGDDQHFEVKIKKPNGKRRNLLLTNIPMYEDNQIVGIFGITKDVTDIKRNEKRINYLAYHDSLTGLANRAYFENSLELMIAETKQDGIGYAVILIDFDRFKIINDTLGHDAGDQLLVAIADRFISLTEHKALVARQGGDEFSLLVKGTKSVVIELLDKIMTGLNKPHEIKGNVFITTPSIGVSYSSNGDETSVDALKKADIAMYASKKNGKNQYTFYEEGLAQESENQLWIENDLYHAINNQEFLLYYQPQIDSTNNSIYGIEALLRWNHPKYGILAPGQFIAIAEETNMILPIGEWVLRQACLEGKKWHESGEILEIAVNISPKQFQSAHLIKMVANIIAETDFNPDYLVLEITEAVAMNNTDETIIKLKELKAMGIHISIDDFGTGHSSLSYLAQLPFDELKIPRELVNELGKETHNAIVSTIITLADNLKLKIIAEGVETNEQKFILQNMNCTNMQGYLFSKPVSREDIDHYFQQSQS